MAVSVQVHNLIASLTNAARKGDMKAVAKWARELAVLADPAPVPPPVVVPAPVTPAPTPTSLTNWAAAQFDAEFVFAASRGQLTPAQAETNPAPGAAKALGFSGVVSSDSYGVFKNGDLVDTVAEVPTSGWPFTFGLAPGFPMDAPYTGPGAVRP